ncbi:MAG: marine proteobacterial sortase target protein [Acidobacteria bacterium]|nr:MAG: marine proteobacterial sortase target protein [Acidobacteriota bacterium]
MTPAGPRPIATLMKMLVLLSLIWNLIAPALAQECERPEAGPPAPVEAGAAGSGELLRKTPGGLVPLPVLDLRVSLEVTGILVHGALTQRFRNPTPEVIECVYVFPLPERAAVHRMEMRIGERRIVSLIREREEARQVYEKARQEGRKTALLEQERPNLFTTSAANINPGETIEVSLEYLQEIVYAGGEFSLSFPLTFTPRFATGGARDNDRVTPPFARPDAAGFPRATLVARIDAGAPLQAVQSDSHAIVTRRDGNVLLVEPRDGSVPADRDFHLRWRPLLASEPRSTLFTEDRADGRYVLLMLLPPLENVGAGLGLPTETLFVLDVSGSMDGPSIEQARAALLAALDRLRPGDTFNILIFNHAVTAFRTGFLPAGSPDLEEARSWVRRLRADGGTRIDLALQRGLDLIKTGHPDRAQRIIFLTDGGVDDEDDVLRMVRAGLGAARLHALGIGPAPNRYLMRKMAEAGQGLCEFISTTSGVDNRVDAFFARLSRPVMTDLELDWEGVASAEIYPSRLPDLFSGEPLFVSARLGAGHSVRRVLLKGRTHDGPIGFDLIAEDGNPLESGVAVRWARARVESLTDALHENADPDAVRRAVIDVSTAFGIVTRYTSLVAVEETPSASGDVRLVKVPSGIPLGSTLLGELPQGGTDEPLLFLVGILLVCSGAAWVLPVLRAR